MSDKDQGNSRYIPAEIRRDVLVEAGHACAIPTCQYPATEFAHIEPFSKVKRHDASNIIALCPNHHSQFDRKRTIDRKAMWAYKLKLQFLNQRYTKYEMRLLAVLAGKPLVLAAGEIQAMGLLRDGLVENAKTLLSNKLAITDNKTGTVVFEDNAVAYFAARLTEKGRKFVKVWKSKSENLLDIL